MLARQGSVDAAIGAISKALELNPPNMDAVLGLRRCCCGSMGSTPEGCGTPNESLAALPSPPPWYYLTRAFNALREQRFFDAIDAAQALAAGDEEFGPIDRADGGATRGASGSHRPLSADGAGQSALPGGGHHAARQRCA